uniref:Uncharacterized protein n=1 Tax=Arundo donax TaxID=35708 RepID=A0A0A8Y1G1_ARUDO
MDAKECGNRVYGKVDDITVIVASDL